MTKINTKKVKLSEVKLNPDNPRTITKKDMARLVKSLQDFPEMMELREIVVDENMVILGGNMRFRALREIKAKDCTVKIIQGLTDEQKREFVIKDNGENWGRWDFDALANTWDDLPLAEWGVGLPEDWLGGNGDNDDLPTTESPEILKSATLEDLAPSKKELELLQGRKVLIEFSGGKDSSSAVLWAKHFLPDSEIILNFVDLGSDHVSLPSFLCDFAGAVGLDLHILRSEKTLIDLFLEKNDWPAFGFPFCQNMLHEVLDIGTKEFDPSEIVVIRGGRKAEKGRATKAQKNRFISIDRMKDYTFFQPLYFTAKEVSETILKESRSPIWSGYGYGLGRTACRTCPGQRQGTYAAIKANFPDVWDELLWLEGKLGAGCWRPTPEDNRKRMDFKRMAERGEETFLAGDYKVR